PAEPGAIGGVAANDQRLSAAIITSHAGVEKGGESAQGGGGSDGGAGSSPSLTAALAQMGFDSVDEYQDWLIDASDSEAFVCACVLQALLEAQP
ncbi:MAG: hypothetical protein IH889_10650, partial [Planctomycetes bacterium]|nr:hypothetical protein [Planctomycetota bacterium]